MLMTSKLILAFVILTVQSAYAGCLSRTVEQLNAPLETYSFCKNTLSSLGYQVSYFSSYGAGVDNFVMLFQFDPRGSSVVCRDFSVAGINSSSCEAFRKNLDGKMSLKKKYSSGSSTTHLLNLEDDDDRTKVEAIMRDGSFAYTSASSFSEVSDMGCFSALNLDKKVVYLGYTHSNFYQLGYCINGLEQYISSDIKVAKELVR